MAGALNLSLLSRGIGEVQKNGHEKVEVKLEPEDYFNWAEDPRRLYTLPPLSEVPRPKLAFESPRSIFTDQSLSPRDGAHLPKTFTTRRGALLLFSEDMAEKNRPSRNRHRRRRHNFTKSLDDIDLHTVGDLTKSILAYGGKGSGNEVNLKLVSGKIRDKERSVRPGFSARRYLASWTKNFDFAVLSKLTSKGYISLNNMFESNLYLPHLKRKLDDNLSYNPMPYRIMRQMLMSPGTLSGYSFFRMATAAGRESAVHVPQELESGDSMRPNTQGSVVGSIHVFKVKDGVAEEVDYTELDKITKKKVLTDLLVKSAINHALKKQQSLDSDKDLQLQGLKMQGQQSESNSSLGYTGSTWAHEVERSNADKINTKAPLPSITSKAGAPSKKFVPSTPSSLPQSQPAAQLTVLPPIQSESDLGAGSQQDPVIPHLQVEPPTPQLSFLSTTKVPPLFKEDNIREEPRKEDTETEELSKWASHVEDAESIQERADKAQKKREEEMRVRSARDRLGGDTSTSSRRLLSAKSHEGPVLSGGQHLSSSAESINSIGFGLRPIGNARSGKDGLKGSQESLRSAASTGSTRSGRGNLDDEDKSSVRSSGQGSVIIGPGGEAISVGGSLSVKSADLTPIMSVHEANANAIGYIIDREDAKSQVSAGSAKSRRSLPDSIPYSKSRAGSVDSTSESLPEAPPGDKIDASIRETAVPSVVVDDLEQDGGSEASHVTSQQVDASHVTSQVDGDGVTSGPTSGPASRSQSLSQALSEQELIDTLTEHAQRIAATVLANSESGNDLTEDAKAAIGEIVKRQNINSSGPSTSEYKEMLRETLASVVSKNSGSPSIPSIDEISPDLLDSLANQQLQPDDIEIVKDEDGKSVVRSKSEQSRSKSEQSQNVDGATGPGIDLTSLHSESLADQVIMEDPVEKPPSSKSSLKSSVSIHEEVDEPSKSSPTKSATAKTPEKKDEFVVGKVDDKEELKRLYAPVDIPPSRKEDLRTKTKSETPATPLSKVGTSQPKTPGSVKSKASKKSKTPKTPSRVTEVAAVENLVNGEPTSGIVQGGKSATPGQTISKPAESEQPATVTSVKKEPPATEVSTPKKSDTTVKTPRTAKKTPEGKVEDKKEMEKLYGQISPPAKKQPKGKKAPAAKPKAKAKLPPVEKKKTVVTKVKKAAPAKPAKAKAKKVFIEEETEAEEKKSEKEEIIESLAKKEEEVPPEEPKEPTEDGEETDDVQSTAGKSDSEMSFIIVRDEFESEDEVEPKEKTPSPLPYDSVAETEEEEESIASKKLPKSKSDDSAGLLKALSNKEARAAKRAAEKERKKREIERKRREREDKVKREKEAELARERLKQEMEEEKKRKEEQKRLTREKEEAEEQAAEEAVKAAERRKIQEIEREKKMKEEYAKRVEEMRKKQLEEDEKRKEQQRLREIEEEERRKQEEEMMAAMAEDERKEYEKKKRELEELRKLREEQERLQREEEARLALEEAKRIAEEMARRRAELEARLMFQRGLNLEADGLDHTQDINRAFVWSYYELLQWLGLDPQDFENKKIQLDKL